MLTPRGCRLEFVLVQATVQSQRTTWSICDKLNTTANSIRPYTQLNCHGPCILKSHWNVAIPAKYQLQGASPTLPGAADTADIIFDPGSTRCATSPKNKLWAGSDENDISSALKVCVVASYRPLSPSFICSWTKDLVAILSKLRAVRQSCNCPVVSMPQKNLVFRIP